MRKEVYKLSFPDQSTADQMLVNLQGVDGTPVKVNVVVGYTDGEDEEGNPMQFPVMCDKIHYDMIATLAPDHPVRAYICPIALASESQAHTYRNDLPMAQPTPTGEWLKADIQAWLTNNEPPIQWSTSMTKAQLLQLVP